MGFVIDEWISGDEDEKIVWFAWLSYFIFLIGLWKLLACILNPFLICCNHCVKCKQNLNGKYGRPDKSAYAVVTGGSDGIGLELCH